MIFYDCSTAPSPRRVRMAIAEKQIDIETVQVDLAAREQLQDEFLAINPKATVPVLALDDGTFLSESMAITIYLDGLFPEHNLTGLDFRERAFIAMAQSEMELNGVLPVAECFRNSAKGFVNRALTGPVDYAQIPELAERGRTRVGYFFESLDKRLSDQEFVAGDRFTVADITAFVAVQFSRVTKVRPLESQTHLQRWHESVSARPCAAV